MADQENILVVIDPNDEIHTAFERAVLITPLRSTAPKIYVLVTTDREGVDTRTENNRLCRNMCWFEEVIRNPLLERQLDFEIEISWHQVWQHAILAAAERVCASQIFLPMHTKPYGLRLTFSESKWELLKSANCPVVLVRPHIVRQRKTILAAVNFQATSPRQKELNQKILQRARWLAEIYEADFHLVNGYMDSMHYPDRGKLANQSRLPSEKIHVWQGYTDKVVSQVAKDIAADVVVLGTLGQNGKPTTRRGNTAERVISAIDADAVIINT